MLIRRSERLKQDLARQNAVALSAFFKRIIYQLKHFEADLLLIFHETELIKAMIRMIRQGIPQFRSIPSLALISDESDHRHSEELQKLGVKLASTDSMKLNDTELVRMTLDAILS